MNEALDAENDVVTLTPPVRDSDHTQGLPAAATTLVEYGDYHCADCVEAHPLIKALQNRLGDRLHLVFRHFPAPDSDRHAAEAAEAAGKQERFWEMHDKLLNHPWAIENSHLVEYARDLGLDTRQFLRHISRRVSAERVELDRESGVRSGVRSTPAFFVNGVRQRRSWKAVLASMSIDTSRSALEIEQ